MLSEIKNILTNTLPLGITEAKLDCSGDAITVYAMSADRSVVASGTFNNQNRQTTAVFGIPSLDRLKVVVDMPEYQQEGSTMRLVSKKDDPQHIESLLFTGTSDDYTNEYRLMSSTIANERIKVGKLKQSVDWTITVVPSEVSVQRLRHQTAAVGGTYIEVACVDSNLVFMFGDPSMQTGKFIFAHSVGSAQLKRWQFPIKQVSAVLSLTGDKILSISNSGVAKVTLDTGDSIWEYIIPACSL